MLGSAYAADLPSRKAPPVAYAPPPVFTWTGFYIGANAGGTWAQNNAITTTSVAGPCNAAFAGCVAVPNYSVTSAQAATFSIPGRSRVGFIGGGQLGYNWQFNSFVAGIEADFQGIASNNNNANTNGLIAVVPNVNFPGFPVVQSAYSFQKLNYLGTVRGRLGFLATPALLLYATGGLAYGGVSGSTGIVQDVAVCAGAGTDCRGSSLGAFSRTRLGYTLGGGLEWMFLPNWSVKAEYMYYDLGRVTSSSLLNQICTGATCAVNGGLFASSLATSTTRYNGHVARLGLNYHFAWGAPAPVVARY
ncbi:MAG: porin family protein [Beijerinckiaceae bacterium]